MCTIGEAHTNQNYITRQHLVNHLKTTWDFTFCGQILHSKGGRQSFDRIGRTFLAENSHIIINDNSTSGAFFEMQDI